MMFFPALTVKSGVREGVLTLFRMIQSLDRTNGIAGTGFGRGVPNFADGPNAGRIPSESWGHERLFDSNVTGRPPSSGDAALLTLDLGTATGWAVCSADRTVVSDTVSFRPSRYDGDCYGAIRCPVQLLWGVEDSWISLERGRELAQLIPGCQLTLIPGSGHLMQIDAPEAIVAAALGFLA